MPIGKGEIQNRFGFHKATIEGENATSPVHAEMRKLFCEFAERLDELLPDEWPMLRSKMTAFDRLEEASMWSHKAVAGQAPLIPE